ncbi:hypothetical protein IWQ56_007319, partial [Coemansia nantahalensis]
RQRARAHVARRGRARADGGRECVLRGDGGAGGAGGGVAAGRGQDHAAARDRRTGAAGGAVAGGRQRDRVRVAHTAQGGRARVLQGQPGGRVPVSDVRRGAVCGVWRGAGGAGAGPGHAAARTVVCGRGGGGRGGHRTHIPARPAAHAVCGAGPGAPRAHVDCRRRPPHPRGGGRARVLPRAVARLSADHAVHGHCVCQLRRPGLRVRLAAPQRRSRRHFCDARPGRVAGRGDRRRGCRRRQDVRVPARPRSKAPPDPGPAPPQLRPRRGARVQRHGPRPVVYCAPRGLPRALPRADAGARQGRADLCRDLFRLWPDARHPARHAAL